MDLPKKYLSYSAIQLFHRDKRTFRQKYYEGIQPPDSAYSIFGREVHQKIENGELPVKRYSLNEYKFTTHVSGVPILGYIDSFDPEKKRFKEFKSGIVKKNGNPRWDQVEVQKLDQLPFYSLCIQEKCGTVHDTCTLIYLETQWEPYEEEVEFAGEVLTETRYRLALTGKTKSFTRRIYQWERDRMRDWITESAKAIEEDYATYKEKTVG